MNDVGILTLNGQVFSFADDTAIVYENYRVDTMQEDLHVLCDFFRINVLSINANKTKYMLIRSINNKRLTDNQPRLYMNDIELQQVDNIKYLGLHIDHCLTWTTHIESLCQEVSRPIGIIFKLRHRLHKNVLTRIYHSLIQSKFSYMLNIWTSAKEKYKKKVSILQNRALKTINKLPNIFSTAELYSTITPRILPVRKLAIKTLVTFVQQCKYDLIHNTTIFNPVNNRNTRTAMNKNLIIPKVKTLRYGKEGINFRAITSYNRLPLRIKQEINIKRYKHEITKWLTTESQLI